MQYWLMKSKPAELSVDDLARRREKRVGWFGVRNYQARNFMMRDMAIGHHAYFYHSSCENPGIYGIVEICSAAYPDPTQFDRRSKYFDQTATKEAPRWFQVDVRLIAKTRFVSLSELRSHPALNAMRVLQRGNRLSISPVDAREWLYISKIL